MIISQEHQEEIKSLYNMVFYSRRQRVWLKEHKPEIYEKFKKDGGIKVIKAKDKKKNDK